MLAVDQVPENSAIHNSEGRDESFFFPTKIQEGFLGTQRASERRAPRISRKA